MSRPVSPAVLTLQNVSKTFRGQRALDHASLNLRGGEVHGLVGQNGSGKSTLIKILAGYHQPEPGASATLRGEDFELGSTVAARAAGLRFIHQDLGLCVTLDVVDNLALGGRYGSSWWISDRRERDDARAVLGEYGVDIDPAAPVQALSAAHRSMLAIVRGLKDGLGAGGVVVLDEPTAALPDQEVQLLYGLIARLRDRGAAILYVSHRLNEIFDICDRVTVLRDGRNVATVATTELDHDGLVELIVGRRLETFYPAPPPVLEDIVLEVDELRGPGVREVSLRVHRGEIVGIAGLVGSGYEAVLGLIFGAGPRSGGRVRVEQRDVAAAPAAAIAAGLAFAPADRKGLGAMLDWTLRENVTLPRLRSVGFARWLSARRERAESRPWLDRLAVVPRDPELSFGALSGGNQQKVVLARWLRAGAKAYLLEEPTNGVDLGAKHAIYEALGRVAADGACALVSSSDAEELCAICDRVLVMRDGRIAAELAGASLSVDTLVAESLRADALDSDQHLSPNAPTGVTDV
jgi:ribose transport system ATP-binding protein